MSRPPAGRTAHPPKFNDLCLRAGAIVMELRRMYPDALCSLTHQSPFELLIATILSAQSTDETVNKVTPILFARYPDAHSLAVAPIDEIESIIRPTGFFHQKALNIRRSSALLVEEFGGLVPDQMESLIRLPGVARKTANVVLGSAFGHSVGVVVDTHVGRVASRLGLTWTGRNEKDAVRIESDLMQIIPKDDWTFFSHAIIQHGRSVCSARKPTCDACFLTRLCPKNNVK